MLVLKEELSDEPLSIWAVSHIGAFLHRLSLRPNTFIFTDGLECQVTSKRALPICPPREPTPWRSRSPLACHFPIEWLTE